MEDSRDNSSGNLINAVKGLNKFDGRKPAEFRDWYKRLAGVLGVARRDIASLAKGKTRPTEGTKPPAPKFLLGLLVCMEVGLSSPRLLPITTG